jgi:hypothetical protein
MTTICYFSVCSIQILIATGISENSTSGAGIGPPRRAFQSGYIYSRPRNCGSIIRLPPRSRSSPVSASSAPAFFEWRILIESGRFSINIFFWGLGWADCCWAGMAWRWCRSGRAKKHEANPISTPADLVKSPRL